MFAALLLLTLTGSADAQSVRRHPVGWDRIARPPLPQPVRAADGSVFVPQALKEFPTIEFDNHVADETATDMFGGDVPLMSPGGFRGARPDHSSVVGANVRTNDTALDPAGSTQSETTIAALGLNMVAGWNDGKNFGLSPGNTGYSSSNNGGLTWTDGGVLPVPSGTARHEGDPVLTNDNAGNFYFSDLYTPDNGTTSAIAVCKGNFSGGVIAWNMPVMVSSTTTDFLDKEWICADKVGGNVYCTWTHFMAAGGNFIEFSRSTDNGATWSPPLALTSNAVESVQGSRVVVGPSGEVQVIYFVFDRTSGNNFMRTRRSTTAGASWGAEVTLPTGPNGIFSGYGSGPAGFNRAGGIGFPSLAVDRSGGANNGRLYATWEETVNFYFDALGTLGNVAEVENNGTSATATPITIGNAATGTLATTADQDWFSFSGTAGQTVILYLVPGSPGGDGFLRVFAGGGATANRTQLSYIGFGTGLCVYTLPSSGTFYFRVLANSSSLGNYIVYTGFDVPDPGDEVARDTRDAVLQSSPDGVTWGARTVVNTDAPQFDNAFPEVAVDGGGQVYVDWYDHHADPLGIGTDIYYATSPTGGTLFGPGFKVNDGPMVNWNNVSSNLAPNMGDYSALVADGLNVYANFADGRQGSPDSWVAAIFELATPALVSLVQADARPGRVDLQWHSSEVVTTATVFRRPENGDWSEIGTIATDGDGMLRFQDTAVEPGARYEYRLGVQAQSGLEYFGNAWVEVPVDAALAVRRIGGAGSGGLDLAVTLPTSDPATLQLIDVSGRSIESVRVSASGQASLGRGGLRSGVYWIKLTQRGQSVTTRTVFLR